MNLKKILKKINNRASILTEWTDQELRDEVQKTKEKIIEGVHENEVIISAFSIIREADKRVLGLFPTNEQVIGALILYDGNIAEMKTGEGKSLVATMPLFLKTLYKEKAFLVTTNDYLARRDYERIAPVFKWLNISVSLSINDPEEKDFDYKKRRKFYTSEIIYTSNSTLGFDYLIDGLAAKSKEKFMPTLDYALIDEVDEILLDSAQTPLIISGNPKVQSNYYELSDQIVTLLNKNEHYKLDEEKKNVWFTEKGIYRINDFLSIRDLLKEEYFSIYQHLVLALKSHHLFKKERDYLVEDGKVKLLDAKDGRVLEGTNLQNGLHQAIQAKEQVEITPETQPLSSITYQNLFRKFHCIAGMSGTAKVAEEEFITTYNLTVKQVQTHKKGIRKDHKVKQYVTFEAKINAALKQIIYLHQLGRPVLVITGSVASSELISMYLLDGGIPHNILNAKSGPKEAQIIQEAGQKGAVTISTTMAGRGTDIRLEEEALQLGGLAVVLTERMLNKRIELQAKGRAGRQGEAGDTYAFESLEDDVVRFFIKDAVQNYYGKKENTRSPIRNLRIKKAFNNAQKLAEDRAYTQRLNTLQFDEILKLQKQSFDASRSVIMALETTKDALSLFYNKAEKQIEKVISKKEYNHQVLHRFILDNIDYNFKFEQFEKDFHTNEDFTKIVMAVLKNNLQTKQKYLNDDEAFLQYLKIAMLKSIDVAWSAQINVLNQLRFVVQPRITAQKKTFIEYEKEAQKSFKSCKEKLSSDLVKNVALSLFEIKKGELIVTFP